MVIILILCSCGNMIEPETRHQAVFLLSLIGKMDAHDPVRHVSQYGPTAWRIHDGVFNWSPIVITQTKDRHLWIGTNVGLIRFNGVRFVQWSPPLGKRLLDPRIFSLQHNLSPTW